MTPHMIDLVHAASWYCRMKGPVLEIGSRIEDMQDHLDLRRAFPRDTPYLGVDVIPGLGVDQQMDLLNEAQVEGITRAFAPKVTLCLYVLEHVWDIRAAARSLAGIWLRDPESWLIVSTHQNQPFHGTDNYPDYWRITASGMHKLMSEAGLSGVHVVVCADTSNPTDVVAVRPPASVPWDKAMEDAWGNVIRATAHSAHWEIFC